MVHIYKDFSFKIFILRSHLDCEAGYYLYLLDTQTVLQRKNKSMGNHLSKKVIFPHKKTTHRH